MYGIVFSPCSSRFSSSATTSGDRRLTQCMAHYAHKRTEDTGRPAFAGRRYVSRHGIDDPSRWTSTLL